MDKQKNLDDLIAANIRESERSGALQRAANWGKPLDLDDAYAAAPPELRMGYKILKDAGCVPAEVEMMQQLAALRAEHAALPQEHPERAPLQQRIQRLELSIAFRMESLRHAG